MDIPLEVRLTRSIGAPRHADVNITARVYSRSLPDDDARAADAWETVVNGLFDKSFRLGVVYGCKRVSVSLRASEKTFVTSRDAGEGRLSN